MSPLLKELATRLADKQAADVILAQPVQVLDAVVWRNVEDGNAVWECKYLSLRGLLVHHPLIYNLVRLNEKPQ